MTDAVGDGLDALVDDGPAVAAHGEMAVGVKLGVAIDGGLVFGTPDESEDGQDLKDESDG
jgi:hypothetical protein